MAANAMPAMFLDSQINVSNFCKRGFIRTEMYSRVLKGTHPGEAECRFLICKLCTRGCNITNMPESQVEGIPLRDERPDTSGKSVRVNKRQFCVGRIERSVPMLCNIKHQKIRE